jgi:thioredoxin 1
MRDVVPARRQITRQTAAAPRAGRREWADARICCRIRRIQQDGRQEEAAMATVELTGENFQDKISAPGITLVDFWAEWCGPCRQFGPVFEKASEKHGDLTFGKVDTQEQQELATALNISAIPMLMIARDGVVVYAEPGALPAAALEDLIEQARGLDMDKVREQIAEATQASGAQDGAETAAK